MTLNSEMKDKLRVLVVPMLHFYLDEAIKYIEDNTTNRPQQCVWTHWNDPDGEDAYAMGCGPDWTFIDGGPRENHCRYCPACGGEEEYCQMTVERLRQGDLQFVVNGHGI